MYTLVNGLQGGLQIPQPRFQHRKQKGKEKSPPKSFCEKLTERLKTFSLQLRAAVLIILALLGFPVFYITLNFLLGPGLISLGARFRPATCVVASSSFKEGQVNCAWSSCHQGCTRQELYTCWQVLVFPRWGEINLTDDVMVHKRSVRNANFESTKPKINLAHSSARLSHSGKVVVHNRDKREIRTFKRRRDSCKKESKTKEREKFMASFPASSSNQTIKEDDLARLKINAAGCDYLSCDAWWQKYGRPGMTFPCYVGDEGRLAVPEFDAGHAAVQVIVGVLPLVLAIISICLIYGLYCRKGHTDKTLNLSPQRSAKKAKMDEIRAKLIMERSLKDKEPRQGKLGNMWTFALNSRNMAKIRPAEGDGAMFDKAENNNNPNISHKMDPLDHWRNIAVMASQHPAVSPARKFNEVEIDFDGGRDFTGTIHHEPCPRLSWSDEYLIQDIDDEGDC